MLARRALGALVALLGPLALLQWGCNAILGIEKQGPRAEAADAQGDADVPLGAAACTEDADCIAPDACYTAHCDTGRGRCWYGLCEVAGNACAAGACNPETRRCEGATDYGFRTTSYPITAVPACADVASCVVASWPFVFVGTSDGVVATFVDDPIATAARSLTISGFDGPVTKLVMSGSRLWILGAMTAGDGGPLALPLGWVDVPSDPTVRRLEARTSSFEFPHPAATAFAAPDGGLYIAIDTPDSGFASALVKAPLPERGRFELGPSAGRVPADAGAATMDFTLHPAAGIALDAGLLAASSGERLVVHSYPSTYVLVASPGSPAARAEAPSVVSFPPPLVYPSFAQGPDGVLLQAGSLAADLPSDCNCTSVSRARWLLASGDGSTIEPAAAVDVGEYQNLQIAGQACHTCTGGYFLPLTRVAWLDSKRALVAAAASDPATNRVRASVHVLSRDPLGDDPSRRFVIPAIEVPAGNFAADRVALTTDRERGYLLLSDATRRTTLSIFDPRCEAEVTNSR